MRVLKSKVKCSRELRNRSDLVESLIPLQCSYRPNCLKTDLINCEPICYLTFSPSYMSSDSHSDCARMRSHTLSYAYLLRTISIGTPGFTIAIFIHSLPRSKDMTAMVAANKDIQTLSSRRFQCFLMEKPQ